MMGRYWVLRGEGSGCVMYVLDAQFDWVCDVTYWEDLLI